MRLINADALIEKCGDWYVEEGTESGFIGTLENLLVTQPTITPEPQWIPVTERLPDNSRNVLITSRGGVSMAWYNGSYFEKGANTHHRKMQTVTAWCELPEPFNGVTE